MTPSLTPCSYAVTIYPAATYHNKTKDLEEVTIYEGWTQKSW